MWRHALKRTLFLKVIRHTWWPSRRHHLVPWMVSAGVAQGLASHARKAWTAVGSQEKNRPLFQSTSGQRVGNWCFYLLLDISLEYFAFRPSSFVRPQIHIFCQSGAWQEDWLDADSISPLQESIRFWKPGGQTRWKGGKYQKICDSIRHSPHAIIQVSS